MLGSELKPRGAPEKRLHVGQTAASGPLKGLGKVQTISLKWEGLD